MFDGVRLRRSNAPQSVSACVFGRVCETAIVAKVSVGVSKGEKTASDN